MTLTLPLLVNIKYCSILMGRKTRMCLTWLTATKSVYNYYSSSAGHSGTRDMWLFITFLKQGLCMKTRRGICSSRTYCISCLIFKFSGFNSSVLLVQGSQVCTRICSLLKNFVRDEKQLSGTACRVRFTRTLSYLILAACLNAYFITHSDL